LPVAWRDIIVIRDMEELSCAQIAGVLLAIAGFAWMSSEETGLQSFAARSHRDYARGAFRFDVASSEPQVYRNGSSRASRFTCDCRTIRRQGASLTLYPARA